MREAQQERQANEQAQADQRRATLEQHLQGWVGRPSSELVEKWTPTQTTTLPDRTMVLEYDFVGAEMLGPTEESKVRLQRAEEMNGDWCKERFVIAANGKVARYTWQGNGAGCPLE